MSYNLWKVIAYLLLLLFTDQDPDPGHILRHTQGGMVMETTLAKLASQKSSILQNLEAQETWQVQSLEDILHRVHHHLKLTYSTGRSTQPLVLAKIATYSPFIVRGNVCCVY